MDTLTTASLPMDYNGVIIILWLFGIALLFGMVAASVLLWQSLFNGIDCLKFFIGGKDE